MKKLENKKTEIPGIPSYAELVKQVANFIPAKTGATPQIMRERIRLIDAAERAGEFIELEDTDLECLKKIEGTVEWTIVHKDFVRFSDDVAVL